MLRTRKTICGWLMASLVLCCVAQLDAADRPAYKNLRYEEDWSVMEKGVAGGEDTFDDSKYISLGDSMWLSLGGQVRERVEIWDDFNFGGANVESSDHFSLTRIRAHADLHVTDYLRLFYEHKSSFATDRELPGGLTTLYVDDAAVQNGFVDINIPISEDGKIVLRGGRQELSFGKQRLVSPLDWSNTRRTFDGGRVIVEMAGWRVDAFQVRPVAYRKHSYNREDHTQDFYGVYLTSPEVAGELRMDLYWLYIERNARTYNGTTGNEERHTIGTRLFGALGGGVDFDLEGAYQFGEVGHSPVDAYMLATQIGYGMGEDLNTRFHVGFDISSGDHRPGGAVQTFSHLFPLSHAYNGYIDALGRQNVIDYSTGAKAELAPGVVLKMDHHMFWRTNTDDGMYNAGGALSRNGNTSDSHEIGQETDVTVIYKMDRHAKFLLGYSHFYPGEFIRESGSDHGIDFTYASVEFTF